MLPLVFGTRLADLLPFEETIQIGDAGYALGTGSLLRRIASGELPPVEKPPAKPVATALADLLERRRPYIDRWWPDLTERGHPPETLIWIAETTSRSATDRKVADELGIDPFEVALLSFREWEQPFEGERNRRALEALGGPSEDIDRSALQARRGVATREMTDELREIVIEGKS